MGEGVSGGRGVRVGVLVGTGVEVAEGGRAGVTVGDGLGVTVGDECVVAVPGTESFAHPANSTAAAAAAASAEAIADLRRRRRFLITLILLTARGMTDRIQSLPNFVKTRPLGFSGTLKVLPRLADPANRRPLM